MKTSLIVKFIQVKVAINCARWSCSAVW